MQSSIEHIHAGKKCTKITPDHVLMLMLVYFTANHACGAGTKVAPHAFQCSLQWLWTSQSSSCSGEQRVICVLWVFTGRLVMQGNPQQFGHLPQRGTPGTSCLCSVGLALLYMVKHTFVIKGKLSAILWFPIEHPQSDSRYKGEFHHAAPRITICTSLFPATLWWYVYKKHLLA